MKRRGRVAAGALAIGLAASVTLHLTYEQASKVDPSAKTVATPGTADDRVQVGNDETPRPEVSVPKAGSQDAHAPFPQSSPRQRTPAEPPPNDTLRVDSRYLKNYGATRASWDDVIDRGRPLPTVSAGCADRWRKSGKDPRLNWKSVDFLCMNALKGRGYRPQGIGGSATTQHYTVDAKPAADRNIVLTSWYSRAREPGLLAPNPANEIVTRLVVMDMDERRYNSIELVMPDGRGAFRNLNSHGSGLVWAGQYIYSSSRSALWMYNADDILEIDGRFVLPAIARWSVHGNGGLSSISLDRSVTPNQLMGINYTRYGQAYIHSFQLAKDGLLAPRDVRAADDMFVKNEFGEKGRLVHSVSSWAIPGTSYQGVGGVRRYTFANSSGLRIVGRGPKRVDATAVFKGGDVIAQFQMPHGNGESVYIDYKRAST